MANQVLADRAFVSAMASEIFTVLIGFSAKLADDSLDDESKLRILKKLDEVTVTRSLLSDTGIVRTVRRFKSEPNEIGLRARRLLKKWRVCLDEHMKKSEVNESKHKRHLKEKKKFANEPEFCIPSQPTTHESLKRRPSEPVSPSLDASSGLSFEEAMKMSVPLKKKPKKCPNVVAQPSTSNNDDKRNQKLDISRYPSRTFTEEILRSLADPCERPDVRQQPTQKTMEPSTSFDDLGDDGNLKFRSKKVIWAPRTRRNVEDGINNHSSFVSTDGPTSTTLTSPPRLLDLCLTVLSKNISMIDHVGLVPYELFSSVLEGASPEDLLRIERCNPQFHGMTGDLWKKHVHLRFPQESRTIKGPGKRETWFDLYERLSAETNRRLDQFINRSASKLRAQQESRRKTLMTDVITPSQIERRANRMMNYHRGIGAQHRSQNNSYSSSSRNSANLKMAFKPRNMSYPTPPPSDAAGPSSYCPEIRSGSERDRTSSSMLQKLRKQFLRG